MNSFPNTAIAIAYFLIPLLLLPLVKEVRKKEIWLNLLLAVAFVFSCGVGHILEALHIHSYSWHWVTAIVSWVAAIVLVKSQSQLRYLSKSLQLLEASWNQSIVGEILFERVGNDLRLLKINQAGQMITNHLIQPGDLLCEKMPAHRQKVYPYNTPLIDLYLRVLESGQSQRFEFSYEGEVTGWYLNVSTAISKDLLLMTFLEITDVVHDPLTGIYNRRILEDRSQNTYLANHWHTCFYIDLDRFKVVNDQQGHQTGDKILVEVARILRHCAREHNGIAVREGGDEFLLLLPDLPQDAYSIAVQILYGIQAIDVEGAKISASIGVAMTEWIEQDGDNERLRLAAETAARTAKRDKSSDLPENRICVWQDKTYRGSRYVAHPPYPVHLSRFQAWHNRADLAL